MHHRSSISLFKLISIYPFQTSSKPTAQFLFKSITTLINQSPTNPIPSSNPNFNPNFPISNPQYHFTFSRNYSNNVDTDKIVDEINLKFAEAREEIEMAMESKETVYFNEEAECARAVTKQVLDLYDGLLAKLPESEKGQIQRSMGLKIEQLKAEIEQLNE